MSKNNLFIDGSEDFSLGFVDGEGCFCVTHTKARITKEGKPRKAELIPSFSIGQDEKDILLQRMNFFNCGKVRHGGGKSYKFEIRSISDLITIIIPFFKANLPRTKAKKQAFEKFIEICQRMDRKEHETDQGFKELSTLATLVNKTQNLKEKLLEQEFENS